MRLSVIIVNYNVRYFLEQCLYSVMKAVKGINAEILVVDNASNDGSREYLEPKFPEVRFSWNEENTGFAKANNQALQTATGEYVLFLNPDTIIPEDCFHLCLAFMDQHPQAGGLGIRMLDGRGHFLPESKRAFPSPLTSFFKMTGLTQLFPASPVFARYYMGHLDPMKNNETDVLAGAFLLVRKSVLEITGGFDEAFFMYGEDIDLSYRIQKAGYKNYYFADSTIIHFKGESTKKGSLNYVRFFYKAMNIFVTKHYGGVKAGLFHFFINTAILFRAVVAAIANLIRHMGLPLIDAVLILLSFWLAKYSWNNLFTPEVIYSKQLLTVAFPSFTLLFLLAAYYTGLYDTQQSGGQLIKSTAFAVLCILAFYSLLPERYRFSRAILLLGSGYAFILLSACRALLRKWKIIDAPEKDEYLQTVITGTETEYERVLQLQKAAGREERILGRIALESDGREYLGILPDFKQLIQKINIKEVIFCENGLSFKEIIEASSKIKEGIRIRITAKNSESVVGSDSKDSTGVVISSEEFYLIDLPVNRRLKRLIDSVTSVIFLISFPVQLFVVKNITGFFKNCVSVLSAQKTWIGYTFPENDLPRIRPGVLGSSGLPVQQKITTATDGLQKLDLLYAKTYSPYKDIILLWKSYRFLGS